MKKKTLEECFYQIRNGANIKQGVLDGGYPITRIETTSDGRFNRNKMGYAGIIDLSKYESYVLEDGDLLMSHINSIQYLGRTVLYKKKDAEEKIIHGMNLLSLKANKDVIKPEYARYYFCSSSFKKQITRIAKKSVNQASFTVADLKKLVVDVPPLSEQMKIAEILDCVNEVIFTRRQELQKLDDLVKARFVEMFGGYERTTTIARYISELRGGKSLAGTVPCKNKVLKTGAATFGWFDPEQYKYLPADYEPLPEHKVETGDVIISRMNTPELVGACSYVFNAPDNMYYPDRLWKAVLQENTNPIFLWQLLWDSDVRKAIKEKSGGTSGTMHNISKPNLLAIKCMDAPIELQNQFAAFVHQVDKSKAAVQKSLDKLQILFDKLMQEYFG